VDLKVGFIGLGNQGAPIARHIIEAGYPTTLWARRPESLEPFAGTVSVARTPAELAAASDLVGVCTWDDASVDDVVLGDEGVLAGARPGTIVAIHATVSPDTCTRLAAQGAARGVIVIDAPVSGGPDQSAAGTLLVMVGGSDEVVAKVRPVFDTFSTSVLHLGDVGAGQLAKLVNNTLLTANVGLAASAVDVGRRIGIDGDNLVEVILNGTARSFAAGILQRNRVEPTSARGTLAYLDKDVHLLIDTARAMGADPTSSLVQLAEEALDVLRSLKARAEAESGQGAPVAP
jgi:3-hydroxyisobutyrate dehydrogenase-like beta-hydroxyacid dehydrogenase